MGGCTVAGWWGAAIMFAVIAGVAFVVFLFRSGRGKPDL